MKNGRLTKRFNKEQEAELELFKQRFHIDGDSEAIDLAISFANKYVKNVSMMFFEPDFTMVLQRNRKTNKPKRVIY